MRGLLIIFSIIVLVSCAKDTSNVHEKSTPVGSKDSNIESVIKTEITPSTEQTELQHPPVYLAENENGLTEVDFKTAYELCVNALTDYYKAVWEGTEVKLATFIDNEKLKKYTQKKIQSQYDTYAQFNDKVQDIKIGAWEVEYTDDVDGGFLYLKLPVEINNTVGSRGEVTEFLVRNVSGKLAIVDWYTGTKDGYDFLERGENLAINNPNIWSDNE